MIFFTSPGLYANILPYAPEFSFADSSRAEFACLYNLIIGEELSTVNGSSR